MLTPVTSTLGVAPPPLAETVTRQLAAATLPTIAVTVASPMLKPVTVTSAVFELDNAITCGSLFTQITSRLETSSSPFG